jgi:hypothetical protein
LIWGTILLNILLGAFVTWLFTNPSSLAQLPIGGIVRNPYPFLISFIVLLSLTVISGVGNLVQAAPSRSKLLRRYLGAKIGQTELLTLRGIPAGLIAESVRLDQVFIPSQLRSNRPRTDYPLSDSELEQYRHYLAQRTASSDSGLRDLERIIVDAEKDWQSVLKQSDRISIADILNNAGRISGKRAWNGNLPRTATSTTSRPHCSGRRSSSTRLHKSISSIFSWLILQVITYCSLAMRSVFSLI